MRLVVVATLLLCLTQCGRPSEPSQTSESNRQRMAQAAANRRIALTAAIQLPGTFADDCALHSGAADSQTYDLERQAWLNGCRQFKKLGQWRSLDVISSSLGRSNGFVLVEGRAVFDAGEYRLQSFWKVGNDRAEIFFLGLKNGVELIDVPSYPALPGARVPRDIVPRDIIDPPVSRDAHS